MRRVQASEIERMERYLGFLANTASAGPFIGLFGTVVGIISSFQSIGAQGSASLAVVAPGSRKR
jgi:biopolymer transport protein TolQ